MTEIALNATMAWICGGASAVVLMLMLSCFFAIFAARSGAETSERIAAWLVAALAWAMSLAAFASAAGGIGGPFAGIAAMGAQLLAKTGFPLAILQLQVSTAAVVIAYFAWQFPRR